MSEKERIGILRNLGIYDELAKIAGTGSVLSMIDGDFSGLVESILESKGN